jgi:4-hydroxybenzoate polyprenyltransferase
MELSKAPGTFMTLLLDLFRTMRPRQWTKNGVLLAALVFDRQLSPDNTIPVIRTFVGLVLFCLLSSSIYIINDLVDVEADRQHPEKRHRPIASGRLPKSVAIAAAAAFLVITFSAGYVLSPQFAAICLAYLLLNLAYSFWLKHMPILDAMSIAAGFVLRVGAGVVLIVVERFSPWLYVVTTLLALYLAFGKRRAELALLATGANAHRRVLDGYTIPLLDQFITILASTTIIVYSLYTFSAPNLPGNHAMMLTIPFALYGIFRYQYLIEVKHSGGAPEESLLNDRPLQVTILLWGICVLLILYGFR